MLATRHPVFIYWGPDLVCLYNDAYSASLGPEKHPSILGVPGPDAWAEIWPIIGSEIEQVIAGGEPTWRENHLVPFIRHGRREDVYWTYSFGPINDVDAPNGVGGVLVLCTETTQTIVSQRASESRYRMLFESIDEGFCILHLLFDEQQSPVDYRFVEINPVFEQQTGLKNALGRTVRDLVPDIEPIWIATYGKVALSGEPTRFVDHALSLGRWFDVYAFRIGEPGERLVAVLFTDITERWQGEEALRRSEARFRTLANATSYVVYRMSPDWAEMRELDGHGFLADTRTPSWTWLTEYIPADEQPRVMAAIQESIRTKSTYELEHRVLRVDGSLGWTQSRAVPILGPDGEITEWFGTASDVTARKEAERALRNSEERFRSMADAVPQIVWITDAEGVVEFFNRKWSDYTGIRYEPTTNPTCVAEVIASFVHPDDAALTAERFEAARRTGDTYLVEHRLRSKDGEYHWFLVRGEPYRDPCSGAIVRWFGTSTDIHDRKAIENDLRKSKNEAERATLSKSKFLAAASHDLRQPMQSLLLFLEVLKPHVAPKGQEALKHLGRGLDALRDLLDSLLDISRLDAGVVKAAIEDFSIGPLVEQIASGYAPVAAAKGLEFHTSLYPAVVRSDRTLLGRMVRNLVENALRYTEEGGITVACHAAGDALCIEVQDTGIGIPPEHLERIWEEFHQVGNPERDRNRGLGLGLAIVQRLSSLLDHSVEVRSTPGRGSVFTIAVPLGRAELRRMPTLAREGRTEVVGNGRFAVLVDDDMIVLLGLKATFEAWGYEVLAAGSTERAMAALGEKGRRPDIVVADYRLREGRNGTEAILAVRAAYGGDVPGIILTGESGAEVQKDAAEHGLSVIHKPVTPRQLSIALEGQTERG
jgi:PAS domain S-box-containing protein